MGNSAFYEKLMSGYDGALDHSGISGERLASRLAQIAEIGPAEGGGVTRPGYSAEEKQAKELVAGWMKEAGMEVTMDGAGNVFGILGAKSGIPAVASGSHVDSVPNGGNFDGPLGVLAALEVAEAWRAEGIVPAKPYIAAVFSDEEGSRFKSGLTGSSAFMGEMTPEDMTRLKDEDGKTLEQVLREYGTTPEAFLSVREGAPAIESFTEVHIEQGTVLEEAGQPVGVVSGIAGPCWLAVSFGGEAAHAGNTPMGKRKDALIAASIFIQAVETLPGQVSGTAVATVGKLDVSPNGTNVVAERASMIVDIRDIHEDTRDALVERVKAEAELIATERGVNVDIAVNTRIMPLPIDDSRQQDIAGSLSKFGIEPRFIPSGAGHDAMILGRTIPAAMIFVRSQDGISHNPKEWTSLADCVLAVHVLKDYVEKLIEIR